MDNRLLEGLEERRAEAARMGASLKNMFYAGPEFKEIKSQFARLLAERSAILARPPYEGVKGLAVVGGPGAGKTCTMNRVFSEYLRRDGAVSSDRELRIVSLPMPSPAGLKLLGKALLTALGYPIKRQSPPIDQIWDLVREQLRRQRIDVLHLDEAQDILKHKTDLERENVVKVLKSLSQDKEWPLMLVLSGTEQLAELINSDPQLVRRLRTVGLNRISVASHGHRLAKVIESFSAEAKVPLAEEVALDHLVERLIHGADHQFGTAIELIIEAIIIAIEDMADRLEVEHFAWAYTNRHACDGDLNAFLCGSLDDVDASKVLARPDVPDGDNESKASAARRRRKKR